MKFTITIQPANVEFTSSSNQTLLAAALLADIDMPYGCQGGACGACMVSKVDGEIRYPGETPPALQEEDREAGKILCCQAIACSDIVLNVPEIGNHKEKILTLPTRVVEKELLSDGCLHLKLKLPGDQVFPAFADTQRIEILAGAGKTCRVERIENKEEHFVSLKIKPESSDSYVNFLFESLQKCEMLRIRGPV